jgi:hypothetical protein
LKKRSIGVTIFGWWYTIGGIIGLLSFPLLLMMRAVPDIFSQKDSVFMQQFTGNFYLLYALAMTIATLAAGIGILKLKSWARKLVIILCAIGLLYSIFVSFSMLMRSSEFAEMSFSSNTLPKDISPETLAAMKSFMQVVLIGSVSLGVLFAVGFAIFVIWFFMRENVVEQFQPERKKSFTTEEIK